MIYNQLLGAMENVALRDFYYAKFSKKLISGTSWVRKTSDTNLCTGYIGYSESKVPASVGETVETNLNFVRPGALLKFTAPNDVSYSYFDTKNNNALITSGVNSLEELHQIPYAATEIWCKVISVSADGTGINETGQLANGTGAVILNDIVPTGAVLSQVIPPWKTMLSKDTITSIVGLIFANKPFGLRYDVSTLSWKIVYDVNVNTFSEFSTVNEGSSSGQQKDSSWLILFTTDTVYYTVKFRLSRYVFESDKQVRFYFDSSDNIYDSKTKSIIKDSIEVLGVNAKPNSNIPFTYNRKWEVAKEYVGIDGYVDTKKVQVTFSDADNDGVVDNPDIFDDIVGDNLAVLERYEVFLGQEDYRIFDNSKNTVAILSSEKDLLATSTALTDGKLIYELGQYFYFKDTNLVKRFVATLPTVSLAISLDYKVFTGRNNLKFQYTHNADFDSRIDPGLTNIIDVYVLTKQYDTQFRQWVLGSVIDEPLPMSSDSLHSMMSPSLNKIKAISDEVVYHPVKYKLLFGNKASENLRATFKITKNPNSVISDNDVKSKTLSAINEFFGLENWDFGDSFYFSELSAYVMSRLSPNIVNFVIVPRRSDLSFGNLFEIRAEKDQIFVNGATIDDIEIISTITTSNIKGASAISTSLNAVTNQSVISSGNA